MTDIADLYQSISQQIVDAIDDEWIKAWIVFEFYGNAGKSTPRYINSNRQEKDFDVEYQTYKAFKSIHNITTRSGDKWNRAKFTLSPNGDFDLTFEWDQDLHDKIERGNN